ncbi:hypothetical protein, partial [Nodosilinea sp. LEGE 07088]|uniref:hypothetical protein n=1 Tax=Nodosilinea sp. LEGE 07088 TaxID=2777968 RepID=UPI001D1331C7
RRRSPDAVLISSFFVAIFTHPALRAPLQEEFWPPDAIRNLKMAPALGSAVGSKPNAHGL